jgi:hypothetical protein
VHDCNFDRCSPVRGTANRRTLVPPQDFGRIIGHGRGPVAMASDKRKSPSTTKIRPEYRYYVLVFFICDDSYSCLTVRHRWRVHENMGQ